MLGASWSYRRTTRSRFYSSGPYSFAPYVQKRKGRCSKRINGNDEQGDQPTGDTDSSPSSEREISPGYSERVSSESRSENDSVFSETCSPDYSPSESGDSSESEDPPSNPDPDPNGHFLSRKQRIIYWALHHLHFGTSVEEAKRVPDLAEVVTNAEATLTFSKDVQPFLDSLRSEYNHKEYYYCPKCCADVRHWTSPCQNRNCEFYMVDRKRSKEMTLTEVHTVDFIPQLEDLMSEFAATIVQFHGMLHHCRNAGIHNEDRSDTRYYDHYYDSIESYQDFCNKNVTVNLSIASDGFVAKRLSKSENWPLYVRMEALSREEKDNYFNSIVAGMLFTKSAPTEKLLNVLSSRLRSELQDLARRPMILTVAGEQWTFKFRVMCGVFDLAGQKDVFGLPRWNSECGCPKCLMPGTRVASKRIWYSAVAGRYTQRTPQSVKADARANQNGLIGYRSFMDLTTPVECKGDWLHLVPEGSSRNRHRDMISPESQFPGLKVSPQNYKKLAAAIESIQNYTHAPRFILGTKDVPKCTGSEFDALSGVLFPLAAARCSMADPIASVSLVGYWLILRMCQEVNTLTKTRLRRIKELTRDVDVIWGTMAPNCYTMKLHLLFHHVLMKEAEYSGSPYQWSSSFFEALHRRLQIPINQSTTNSHALILERFLLTKKVFRIFDEECSPTSEPKCVRLREKVTNHHLKRNPVGVVITPDVYIPTLGELEPQAIQAHHLQSLNNVILPGCVYSSRLVVNEKVYASRVYWRESSLTTQQNEVRYRVPGEDLPKFGSVLLFICFPAIGKAAMLVDEYDTRCPFEELSVKVYRQNGNRLQRPTNRLLDNVAELNTYFYKVIGVHRKVRDASLIMSPAVLIDYKDNNQCYSYVSAS